MDNELMIIYTHTHTHPTNVQQFQRQKLRCGPMCMEQPAILLVSEHQLRSTQATSEKKFIWELVDHGTL